MSPLEKLLRSRFLKRWFFVICILVLVVLVLVKFYVLAQFLVTGQMLGPLSGTLANALLSITDAAFSAVITAMLTAIILLYLAPPETIRAAVEIVQAQDVRNQLERNLKISSDYYFHGRSGRWFGATAIPSLSDQAAKGKIRKRIFCVLPNPADKQLMEKYAQMKEVAEPDNWNEAKIQNHILRTSLLLINAAMDNPYLDIRIGYVGFLTIFRYDVTDRAALLTVDNLTQPALCFPSGSTFYELSKEQVHQAIDASQSSISSDEIRKLPKNNDGEKGAFLFRKCNLPFDKARYDALAG